MDEQKQTIIEAEVTEVKLDDVKKPAKAKKTLDSHAHSIHFLGKLSAVLLSISSPGLLIAVVLGFMFSIFYSETPDNVVRLAIMITSWSFAGLFFIMSALAFGLRIWMRKLKTKDPNFEDVVNHDSIY
jgi:hypothetical protein